MSKIFMFFVLFIVVIAEMTFATIGISILLTLPFIHYFLVSKSFKSPFISVLFIALIIDTVYGRTIPYTLIAYGIFAYLICYAHFFKYNNAFSMILPSIISVSILLVPNLLISLPYWKLTFSLVLDATAIYLFALGVNIILTPFVFAFMDFLCSLLNIPSLAKSRSLDFDEMVKL